jgi:chromosome segregation ATPase
METDEFEKRLEWLDTERQKANQAITVLSDRIRSLEELIGNQKQIISSLEKDLKVVSQTTGRIGQFDSVLEQVKTDLLKQINENDKKIPPQIRMLEKQERDDQNALSKRFGEIQAILPIVSDIKKNLQNRIEEESRLSQRIDSLGTYFEEVKSSFKGLPQEIKRTADDIQLSNKRIADIQVETTTLRKRLDEERNHNEINIGGLQKIEASLKSVLSQEAERKQAQIAFIEKASLAQVERDNTWKAWQEQVNSISGLGDDYSQKILALEATHKAIKQSLSELDQVNSRFDRRINELTEMHRLNEERFRQEWISFKSDDQKRWTNYQLTQEEQQQEDLRQFAKQAERITPIEDDLKDTKESITLINEETEKQLKVFYSAFHDLIESFDQTFSK